MDIKNIRPKIETAYPLTKNMSDAVCSLFNSGKWNELDICAFLTVKDQNPKNLGFQHLPVKEKIENPYKNNRLQEINRMRIGFLEDTLTSVDIVEIVKCWVVIWRYLKSFSVIA